MIDTPTSRSGHERASSPTASAIIAASPEPRHWTGEVAALVTVGGAAQQIVLLAHVAAQWPVAEEAQRLNGRRLIVVLRAGELLEVLATRDDAWRPDRHAGHERQHHDAERP